MHIRRVEIENIRSIKHLVWELPEEQNGAGWHVILGDNGSGKTSFVKAIALSFLGQKQRSALQEVWASWKRNGKNVKIKCEIDISGEKFTTVRTIYNYVPNSSNYWSDKKGLSRIALQKFLNENLVISFGSSRRFQVYDYESEKVVRGDNILSRHVTVFSEKYSLSNGLQWLKDLRFQELENKYKASESLKKVLFFINETNFLPNNVKIKSISSDGVYVSDLSGSDISITDMSDGYRSMFSLALELIRHIITSIDIDIDDIFDPDDSARIIISGIVQIDEVDLHLHPQWQKLIGRWFKNHFPNMQFIVTTHSPLICWSADSVFVLPTPGTNEKGKFLTEEELNRVKYGSIQEAYMLDAFGEIGRSEEGQKKLVRLTELNNKEWDGELTEADKKELQELRAALPLSALRMKE